MAEKREQKQEQARKPFFSTPMFIVVFGLLLWIAAALAAVLANIGIRNIQFMDKVTEISVTYLMYLPSTLLALIGGVILVIGGVRWAIYGRDVAGVPAPPDNTETLALLTQINDRLLLSDTAKRIAYREHDLQTIRTFIEKDLQTGNFDAAMVLVSDLAQTYGYREEAENYRDRIIVARNAEQEAKISEAIARLNDVLARHEFDQAAQEAAKIQRLFPDSERVRNLSQLVAQTREQYKMQLEREFLETSERGDLDRALDLLKVLDKYLTEEEAAPLRETARGVIGKKRDNLGVQFKMAVHDHEWLMAVRVGEQIIREFPNTRMAEEVRSMIDLLRERAAGQRAAQPGTTA